VERNKIPERHCQSMYLLPNYCHYFRYCTNMTGNRLNRKSRSVQGGKNNRTKMGKHTLLCILR
jgi:hypothetical protein